MLKQLLSYDQKHNTPPTAAQLNKVINTKITEKNIVDSVSRGILPNEAFCINIKSNMPAKSVEKLINDLFLTESKIKIAMEISSIGIIMNVYHDNVAIFHGNLQKHLKNIQTERSEQSIIELPASNSSSSSSSSSASSSSSSNSSSYSSIEPLFLQMVYDLYAINNFASSNDFSLKLLPILHDINAFYDEAKAAKHVKPSFHSPRFYKDTPITKQLHDASKYGADISLDQYKKLVKRAKQEGKIDSKTETGESALHIAIKTHAYIKAACLIELGDADKTGALELAKQVIPQSDAPTTAKYLLELLSQPPKRAYSKRSNYIDWD